MSNQWIVPRNVYLHMRFDCHICCDIVSASACVKYLFKYYAKGPDHAHARILHVDDEIEQYCCTRYISAAETTWPLLGFHVLSRNPSVTLIHTDLENENSVTLTTHSSCI